MWAAFCFITLVFFKGVDTQKSHYGKEFILAMIPNYDQASSKIFVDIASEKEGKLYYSIPYLNIRRNKTLRHGHTIFRIASSLTTYGNFTEQRGIFISTDVEVTVVVTSYYSSVMDSYLALPVSALGLHYRTASYTPYDGSTHSNAEILIVAAYDNTNVTIRGNDGKTTSLNLNKLFIHQISSITDLSNVEIIASKPVSVISGTICANVPHHVYYCDMLLEQMIPTEAWTAGTFIVPPIHMSKGFLLKVLTNSSDTFCLQNRTRTICNSSHYLPEEEFLMGTEPVVVNSSGHISVVQYGLGYVYDNIGDSYMNLIPAIDNYLNEYYFVVPTIYSPLTSYLSVIVPSSESSGLLLDGSTPTAVHQYSVPDLNYTVLVYNISLGYHTLTHSSSYVHFGALVYGLLDGTGYGFPLGFQFSGPKPTVSLTSTSSPTSSSTMTTGSFSSTTGFPPREQRGPICYDCHHVWSPDECNTHALCEQGQVCSIEEYNLGQHPNYKMGCFNGLCNPIGRSVHMSVRSLPVCQHCCDDDYCNTNCTQATAGNVGSVIVG